MPTSPQAQRSVVIFRHWDAAGNLQEKAVPFDRVDELFALCLRNRESELVDRVIVDGVDGQGEPQTITLIFQSASVSSNEESA